MRGETHLHPNPESSAARLRAVAELRVMEVPPELRPALDKAALVHELQVHQIELEMQNDELRRTVQLLETARDRYVDLFDFAPVGYIALNPEGEITEMNHVAAGLLGQDRQHLIGEKFARYVSFLDGDDWHRYARNLLGREAPGHLEFSLHNNGGRTARILASGQRVQNHEGSTLIRITLTDVTAVMLAEQSARESSELVEVLEDSVLDHVAVLDRKGTITATNAAWRDYAELCGDDAAGFALRGAVGSNYLADCQHAEDSQNPEAAAGIGAVLSGQLGVFTHEYACRGPQGGHKFCMSVTSLRSGVHGAVVVHTDISAGRYEFRARNALPLDHLGG